MNIYIYIFNKHDQLKNSATQELIRLLRKVTVTEAVKENFKVEFVKKICTSYLLRLDIHSCAFKFFPLKTNSQTTS